MSTTDSVDPERSSPRQATVALQTLGCKLNQAESETLARRFIEAGFQVVAPGGNPDVYILNTCTVTHIADRKCRHSLRSFHRRNPNSLILATGCYADRDQAGLAQIEGVDMVIGNDHKNDLVGIVERLIASSSVPSSGDNRRALAVPFRTRAMVKIQDGCSLRCTYCIVPHVRGNERSVSADAIVAEIKSRVEEGCNEVVLTGTRVGAYDCMSGLDGLIERILDETTVARIRLSSLRPQELEPSLIRLWRSNERVCRHLHMSLQSGSDATLRRMGRDYSTDEYETALNMIREAMPDIAVTTDVIVGFPGETDDEFEQSYSFCQRIGFADLHIFAYSIRPGTPSAQMTGKVPDKIKKDRSLAMLNMAWHSARDYRRGFTGKTVPVLWEEQKGNNIWIGRTDNYIKIMTRSVVSLCNRLINARLGDECEDALWGELEEDGHIPAQNEERPTGQRSVS